MPKIELGQPEKDFLIQFIDQELHHLRAEPDGFPRDRKPSDEESKKDEMLTRILQQLTQNNDVKEPVREDSRLDEREGYFAQDMKDT
jgi:hypothetical protein